MLHASPIYIVARLCFVVTVFLLAAGAETRGEPLEAARRLIGWGWEDRPHGQSLASDVLGQFADGDPARPNFGGYGPYGGPTAHGFFFFAFNAGRYQIAAGIDAHPRTRKLAVADYWNHRVLLFDLNADGSLASGAAPVVIGQPRFDTMEVGQGPDHFHYPADCAFDPSGRYLFVADEYNHRVLQFDLNAPEQAIRVFGQADFETWGPDGRPGFIMWDSTNLGVRGPRDLKQMPNDRGFFLPRGVVCDGRRLFVSDGDNHRVMVFDLTGSDNGPRASAVLGQADFTFCAMNGGGPRSLSTMLFPAGLALDQSGRFLLVADGMNERVLVFDVFGEIKNGQPALAEVWLAASERRRPSETAEEKKIHGLPDVAIDPNDRVYVSDRPGNVVRVYELADILRGEARPLAGVGKFEMMTDLRQTKSGYVGPTGVTAAGNFLYVVEPRGNRVLCFDARDPERRAVNLLGQFFGNDLSRPDYNKYGPNNGPGPYGFDLSDGSPALSVTADGHWLLAADTIGGRLLFFPLGADGLPVDRSARLTLGAPTLTARANNYGAERFNRPSHSLLIEDGRLFVSDFQGSRILYFEMLSLMEATGPRALQRPRPFVPPKDREPYRREDFEFHSVDSGIAASHVLGQVDFWTGLRDTASERQMGKEMSGLDYDPEREWLFICEKLNHRVLIVDISKGVSTFMPAMAVLGQPVFTTNAPNWNGGGDWRPRGMNRPNGVAYDPPTKTLYVVSGDGRDEWEIQGYDLSGEIVNGMEPAFRIGGPHGTVKTDLPYVGRTLAIDIERRRLWSGLFALDISGDPRAEVPLLGWFDVGPHDKWDYLQDTKTSEPPSLLGYAVAFCHRFGGAISAAAVNPKTGTVYVADNARYRILCYQPEFRFNDRPVIATIAEPMIGLTGCGGLAPLRFDVDPAALPVGIHVDSRTGVMTGTPGGEPGDFDVPVRVKTALGDTRGSVRIVIEAGNAR